MNDPVRSFFTWVMVVVGVLIVALAGPCTLYLAGMSLIEMGKGGEGGSYAPIMLITALIVGGIPFVGGVVLLVVAIRSLRLDRMRRRD